MESVCGVCMLHNKIVLGSEEWCELPDLGLFAVKAKIDSGAKTSVLHAFNISVYKEGNVDSVKFYVHPLQGNRKLAVACRAPLIGTKVIRSSNGAIEKRLVISTEIKIGSDSWKIDLTLTNRATMGYRMLLGREAMRNRVLVDPDKISTMRDISEDDVCSFYGCKTKSKPKIPLDIVLLASNPDLYSNQRIIEAGRARGHRMRFIAVNSCYMNVKPYAPTLYYGQGIQLGHIDAVIPRLKPSMTFYGAALMSQFQLSGIFCMNDANSILNSRDKFKCLQILAERGIDVPTTSFASHPSNIKHLIETVNGAPLVVKLLRGTHGTGVMLAESHTVAKSLISAFRTIKADIMIQEYMKESRGRDIRCFVIDGKIAGSIQREASNGEFRANLHLGATASEVKLTAQEKKIAVGAAKVLGLKVAGVDMIRSNDGPKVLEVNSSPGLKGVESVTGNRIAEMIIECIERSVSGKSRYISIGDIPLNASYNAV